MADFKIKSAAGTGNKTLIQGQDQSGSNYAIQIGDAGALKLGTISAGTISTGVIFPSTHPKLTITKQSWAGDTTGTTETVVADYYAWQNTKASSTVVVEMTFNGEVKRESGTIAHRYAYWNMYYSTSNVSDGATSSFGTNFGRAYMGREDISTSTAGASSFGTMTTTGTFTSSSTIGTQYYFGLTSDSDNAGTRVETYAGGANGTLIKIWEY